MTIIDTVAGIERHAILQAANGVECDRCGKRIGWDRKDAASELRKLAAKGWIVPASATDFTSACVCQRCQAKP